MNSLVRRGECKNLFITFQILSLSCFPLHRYAARPITEPYRTANFGLKTIDRHIDTVRRLFHKKKIVRFYGARPAAVRIVRFFVIFLDIIRCPVKFSYYIKFHGARATFCWVIEGTMTSDGHRTIFENLNHTISTAAGHRTMWEKIKELSKNSIQIGRCPSGHRTPPKNGRFALILWMLVNGSFCVC